MAASADVSQRLRALELDHAKLEGRVDATVQALDRLEVAVRSVQESNRADSKEIFAALKDLSAGLGKVERRLAEQQGSRSTLRWALPVMLSGTAVLATVTTWTLSQVLGG